MKDQRSKDLNTMTKDQFVKSKWFRQNAFTKTEMIIQPLVSMGIAWVLTKYYQPSSWASSFGIYIVNLYVAIFMKWVFYNMIAIVYSLNFMSACDDLFLYDFPINPFNIPVFTIVDKIKEDPEITLKRALKITGEGGFKKRTGIKHRKICGKYFFELLAKDDLKTYIKTRTGIVDNITCEQDAIDFALQLKSVDGKSTENCTVDAYFFPNYSKTESAFLINGHHSYQDGLAGMCATFAVSDNYQSGKYEFPFMKRKEMTALQWLLAYLSTPVAWYVTLKHYYKRKYDVNCIKKHPKYMTGKLVGKICKPISLRLAKVEAKKMNITFNDLVMGMISKAFKLYFIA